MRGDISGQLFLAGRPRDQEGLMEFQKGLFLMDSAYGGSQHCIFYSAERKEHSVVLITLPPNGWDCASKMEMRLWAHAAGPTIKLALRGTGHGGVSIKIRDFVSVLPNVSLQAVEICVSFIRLVRSTVLCRNIKAVKN